IALAALIAWACWPTRGGAIPLPALEESPFRNTLPGGTYVGAARCAPCHQDQAASPRRTAHSQAFREVQIASEPADGAYFHASSGRRYGVSRRNGQFHHTEAVALPGGGEMLLANHAPRYAIGSGRFTQSYLVETDGFLVESPITWYSTVA